MFRKLFSTYKFRNVADRERMNELFDVYMANIPQNFYRNHFELQDEYVDTTYDEWLNIIKHPAFDSWKAEQIAIIAMASTDKALAGGDGSNKDTLALLKMRQDVLNSEKKAEKPTIIVIPESLFYKDIK